MSASSRRTDRVSTHIPVEVSGSCPTGAMFFERTETTSISKFGAAILLSRKLQPEQGLLMRNLQNGREAEAEVLGSIGGNGAGGIYGVKFLAEPDGFWSIDFPPLEAGRDAAMRMVMQCSTCRSRELVYLDELEAEVFCHSEELHSPCKQCRVTTVWKQANTDAEEAIPQPARVSDATRAESAYAPTLESLASAHDVELIRPKAPEAPPAAPRTANERKHVRSKMQIPVCIRRSKEDREEWGFSEEACSTEDCSRGGFSFCTYSTFQSGVEVEVAIPYREGGANIFVPARIANLRKRDDGQFRYGVAYVRR